LALRTAEASVAGGAPIRADTKWQMSTTTATETDEPLTTAEAAELLGVGLPAIAYLRASGALPARIEPKSGEPGDRWHFVYELADVERIAAERLLRTGEAAYMLGLDRDTVRALTLSGELPAYRVTPVQGHARYRLEDVLAYARSRPRARVHADNGGRPT